jgi:hypothetical protein
MNSESETSGRKEKQCPLENSGGAGAKRLMLIRARHAQVIVLGTLALIITLVVPQYVSAYNTCDDSDGDCTHETMTEQAIDLYDCYATNRGCQVTLGPPVSNAFADEIKSYRSYIKTGVGLPDRSDQIYGNVGALDALATISHFWEPDSGLETPMQVSYDGPDGYPNAFGAAKSLWERALGEYAAGEKGEAYRLLGSVAHFLGDQTIPTHAHGRTHGPDFLIDDAYEEWMSDGPDPDPSPNAFLRNWEKLELEQMGPLLNPYSMSPPLPVYDQKDRIEDQLLLIFLITNQTADYFASDRQSGDAVHPFDSRVQPAAQWAGPALTDVATRCAGDTWACPVLKESLSDDDVNNEDELPGKDLSHIRQRSYVPGVRSIAALFAAWERAISSPILAVTVHRVAEDPSGDSIDGGTSNPDYYVGMVMGHNRSTCAIPSACPVPAGSYVAGLGPVLRVIDGNNLPTNLTRTDADDSDIHEDKTVITPNYRYGQAFPYAQGQNAFRPGVDVVDVTLSVWDFDNETTGDRPYESDDIADINPNGPEDPFAPLKISVDLAQCVGSARAGTGERAVTVPGLDTFRCATSAAATANVKIDTGGGGDGITGEDEADIRFSVTMTLPPGDAPPPFVDNEDPMWQTPGVLIILANTPGIYFAAASDNVGVTSSSCSPVSGTTFPLGLTQVNCSAFDAAGNEGTASFAVTGVGADTSPPVWSVPANITVPALLANQTKAVVTWTATASDNIGVAFAGCDPSSGSEFFAILTGLTTVDCVAIDTSGNTGQSSFTVTVVVDDEPPTWVVPADITVSTAPGRDRATVFYTAVASDNFGVTFQSCFEGFLFNTITRPSGSSFPVGETSITCIASDASGNDSLVGPDANFLIIVEDLEDPQWQVPVSPLRAFSNPGSSSVVVNYTATAGDNVGLDSTNCAPASGSVFPVGTTLVTCTAFDTSGNSDEKSFSVMVEELVPLIFRNSFESDGVIMSTDKKQ